MSFRGCRTWGIRSRRLKFKGFVILGHSGLLIFLGRFLLRVLGVGLLGLRFCISVVSGV